jgi:hypothetical protein
MRRKRKQIKMREEKLEENGSNNKKWREIRRRTGTWGKRKDGIIWFESERKVIRIIRVVNSCYSKEHHVMR